MTKHVISYKSKVKSFSTNLKSINSKILLAKLAKILSKARSPEFIEGRGPQALLIKGKEY